MTELLIFDWDGTLCDSADGIVSAMQAAITNLALPEVSDADVRNIIGLSLPEAIATLFPVLSETDRLSLKQAYIDIFVSTYQGSSLFEGVREGLESLRDAGFLLAVATGKARRGLDRGLKEHDLELLFHGSCCADEALSKPDPQMLSILLSRFDLSADRAIMVGDTEYDMSMAKAIGMPRVGVSYGAHHHERLRLFDPLLVVDEFSAFSNWLLKED